MDCFMNKRMYWTQCYIEVDKGCLLFTLARINNPGFLGFNLFNYSFSVLMFEVILSNEPLAEQNST